MSYTVNVLFKFAYVNDKQNLFAGNIVLFNFELTKLEHTMTTTDFNNAIATQSDFLKPYAHSLTQDIEDAKDLFQETIVRALINKDKYRVGTNLKAWLYTIMRNIFINNYRKNKRFGKVTGSVPEDLVMYQVNKSATNDGVSNIKIQEIKKQVEKLPPAFRQSFELHYMGYKYQDIAEILEEPLGTVKSRIHFARKILVSNIDK